MPGDVARLLDAHGPPARQTHRDGRRSARLAAYVEFAAEQPNAFAAADETEASPLRAVEQGTCNVEARAVVLDPRLDAAAVCRDRDADMCGVRVLAESEAEWGAALDKTRPKVAVLYEDNFNYLSKMCLLRMRRAALAMIEAARERRCTGCRRPERAQAL